ncbi:AAA family ATPase [Sessilibacter sp. MAH4]
MLFRILSKTAKIPEKGNSCGYLIIDNWNDYSFVTMFHFSFHDSEGNRHIIGPLKIGFKDQTIKTRTHERLPEEFSTLDEEFFSLGQVVDFYQNMSNLPSDLKKTILFSLRDIVINPDIINSLMDQDVFSTSLLRHISLATIKGQYARVLEGKAELTNFKFKFFRPEKPKFGDVELSFEVEVDSTPRSNIHAIIGRNGVGKTTILNEMIDAITNKSNSVAKFFDLEYNSEKEIANDYFSSLVSVSFSAFDPFNPPKEQPDPAKGTCYFYIGLKDLTNTAHLRSLNSLQNDCVDALISCFYNDNKAQLWVNAINTLSSDENFFIMQLTRLHSKFLELNNQNNETDQSDSNFFKTKFQELISPTLSRMSSGHAIILLTITRLVAKMEEKTLVLLDEPESHLHPPLLSAFVRALSDLLHDKNGLAIIATHSPVVLQEIPKSCVWKIFRRSENVIADRPSIETFAENVGILTSEVFSLEVEKSGFHDILTKSVQSGKTYEEIVNEYNDQIGFEGRALLQVLITKRDRG